MSNVIMIGCDLHDAKMILKIAGGTGEVVSWSWATRDVEGLIDFLMSFAEERDAERIVFAYEASGQGFGLHDQLTEAGIECHVLAPTDLPHTSRTRKNKTDSNDAMMLLDEVRGFVLAGRRLPSVWIPDQQTRCDRELVRSRLELAAQRTRVKNQIRNLLKRYQLSFPEWFTKTGDWSKQSIAWLEQVAAGEAGDLAACVRTVLQSLVPIYQTMCDQLKHLDAAIERLSQTERYEKPFRKLKLLQGVGTLTAMTFLTELGDLDRFPNRRKLSGYLGLVPTAHESGERNDRKGHITRQGSPRVRHVLCQAAWAAIRCSPEWGEKYEQIKRGSKSRTKIAIVGIMRQLGITMWQMARSAELEELLNDFDERKTSTKTRQKGTAPPATAFTPA